MLWVLKVVCIFIVVSAIKVMGGLPTGRYLFAV